MDRLDGRIVIWLALALTAIAWGLFWAQPLYRFRIVPEFALAVLFFAGLGLGAFDQHRRNTWSYRGIGTEGSLSTNRNGTPK